MKIEKAIATAGLTIAALAITGGTSYAAPTPDPAAVQSIQHPAQGQNDLGYSIVRSDADQTVTTTLTGGTFRLTDASVDVLDGSGVVVSRMPLAMTTAGTDLVVSMHPSIEDNGTKLVAHPEAGEVAQPGAADVGRWVPTSPKQRATETGSAVGALGGALGGVVVGVIIAVATGGLGVIALPFAAMIGALIGGGTGSAAGAGTTNDDRQDGWTWQQDCHTDYYTHDQYCY
ncbi:hypothetical protein ACFXG4_36445 [Nocardia sp. NPDC059246]|uniref:hypothetical protein n=1 Tax=unclassified Nocardia TaxID=2637762 RepID=UPI003698740A